MKRLSPLKVPRALGSPSMGKLAWPGQGGKVCPCFDHVGQMIALLLGSPSMGKLAWPGQGGKVC